MELPRKIKIMTRWSILMTALIAAFWGTWYLVEGYIPIGPLGISRGWDVFLGPLYSLPTIFIITWKRADRFFLEKHPSSFIFMMWVLLLMLLLSIPAIPILGIFAGIGFCLVVSILILFCYLINSSLLENLRREQKKLWGKIMNFLLATKG